MIVIFVQQTQLSLKAARMSCDFPLVVVFATSTTCRFVKLKSNTIKFQVNKRTEFNKTIIPFALVGYQIGYSQLGPSHIQRALME